MKLQPIFILGILLLTACTSDPKKETSVIRTPAKGSAYQLASVVPSGVATMIKLPAQLSAYEEVSIFPKVNGYVKQVYVDIGSVVHTGELLMLLDAPETEQATVQAREKYARARADFAIDKEHFQRLLEASATAGAISPLDLSTARAKMEADSSLANAEKTNWSMQQTMQGYLRVIAPFNGVITERNVHPGALVSAEAKDKPMLELKEVDHLRLQVDIPESIAGTFMTKDTVSFITSAFPGKRVKGFISRKSDNVNAQFRSERVEIDVQNKAGKLAPGMYADVVLYSKGNADALSVPRAALVISTERKYVIAVRNGHTLKVDVLSGNETADQVEVFGQLTSGDRVIANANDEIKEGIAIHDPGK
ncbi:MAG TPA: efflux RND transporter periplasmic adaptor subunit [Puia sp.]|nr:efflux RND transporter periplasmic adaptor subunit [Puia sp.]